MNMKEFKPQEKTVVAIGQPADWRDPATVVIGMSDVAFAAMADGRTHTVDLTSQGISVQIVIFREPTLAACRAKLTETQTTLGLADHKLPDGGIPEKKGPCHGERRVGNEVVSTVRSRGTPYN